MLGQIIAPLATFATNIITSLGYPGLVLVMVLENVFPPIPSEAILPFAGYLSTIGRFNFWGVVFSGLLGSVLGALVLYAFGYWGNEKIVRRFLRRYGKYLLLKEADLDHSEGWFQKHGKPAVFTARMIPIIRSIISIPAGLAKMPLLSFLFFTALGTGLWSLFLAYCGKILGENWDIVAQYMKKYDTLTVVILLLLVGYFLFQRIRAKPEKLL